MNPRLPGLMPAHYSVPLRGFVIIFGGIAIWWGVAGISGFSRESSIERIANQIIAGEPFKDETLIKQLPVIQAVENSTNCHPSAARSAAVIRLRMAESTISSSSKSEIDEKLNALRKSILASLSCSPADPFLWLVYYWIQSTQYGSTPEQLKYLRLSYQLGPNEGWIELRRNRIAFAIFEQLPPDLAEDALNEFIGLLETGHLYGQVAEIYVGPAWHVRNEILRRIDLMPDRTRDPFIAAVHRLGHDVGLPKFDKPGRRPWE